ncbi:MAG: 30S ribosomal protein S9 [Patescibacteria group bacterium]
MVKAQPKKPTKATPKVPPKTKRVLRTKTLPPKASIEATHPILIKHRKVAPPPQPTVQTPVTPLVLHEKYVFAVGRRKSSVARARYFKTGSAEIVINGKPLPQYFPYFEHQAIVRQPLVVAPDSAKGHFTFKVAGGGSRGQAESIRLAISRILVTIDEQNRPLLRAHGLLTRDPRVKERKKYGLKSARRAPQWQKR